VPLVAEPSNAQLQPHKMTRSLRLELVARSSLVRPTGTKFSAHFYWWYICFRLVLQSHCCGMRVKGPCQGIKSVQLRHARAFVQVSADSMQPHPQQPQQQQYQPPELPQLPSPACARQPLAQVRALSCPSLPSSSQWHRDCEQEHLVWECCCLLLSLIKSGPAFTPDLVMLLRSARAACC